MLGLAQKRREKTDIRRVKINPDCWYPVAKSDEVKKNKTLAVTFAGEPIVLFRTASGKMIALEDRCAHRQIPLSMGVVKGECLQCSYHSWTYNETGKCVGIPYLEKGQTFNFKIRSYPCREAYGLVFIFPGNIDAAHKTPFPQIPIRSSPKHQTMYFARKVNCHYTFMHENLMDMNHQFLHRRLMGAIKASFLSRRTGTDWLEVDYRFESVGGKKHFGAEIMLGPKDPIPENRKYDIMTIRTQYPYQMLTVRRPSLMEPSFYLWACYVPVDREERTCKSFGLLMIRKPAIPGFLTLAWPAIRYFTEMIFAEDRIAVEAEQSAHDFQGGDWNQEVYPLILELQNLLVRFGIVRE